MLRIALIFIIIYCMCIHYTLSDITDITPEVSIYNEKPGMFSDRIKIRPDGIPEVSVLLGEKVIMECRVFNYQSSTRVVWRQITDPDEYGNSQEIVISNNLGAKDSARWKVSRGIQANSFRLEILVVVPDVQGMYFCEAVYSAAAGAVKTMQYIAVKEPPIFRPYFSSFSRSIEMGRNLDLNCVFLGIPTPRILWTRTGGYTTVIKGHGKMAAGNTLKLKNLTGDDSGQYTCQGSNDAGTVYHRIKLNVLHPPQFRLYPQPNRALQRPGCHYLLLCIVHADPLPSMKSIQWTSQRHGTITNTNKRLRSVVLPAANNDFFNSLSFEPFLEEDLNDVFTCSASNDIGFKSANPIQIQTSYTPYPGRNGNINCRATSIMTPFKVRLPFTLFILLAVIFF